MAHLARPNNAKTRIAYLDGIRGLAISAVLLVHWAAPYAPFFRGGYIGVSLFLVLSGYVITTILWRGRQGYFTFLANRARRLYPALLGTLVGGVALTVLIPNPGVATADALRSSVIALLQWTAPWEATHSPTPPNLFGVTWSLAIEWYFYVLWAAVLVFSRRRSINPRAIARVSVALAMIFWLFSLTLSGGWSYFGPASNSAALLIGSALALRIMSNPVKPKWWDAQLMGVGCSLALICLAGWLVFGGSQFGYIYRVAVLPLTCVATSMFIATGYWSATQLFVRGLSSKALTGLGRVSYSLYLWHTVPLILLTRNSLSLPRPILAAIGVLSASLLTAVSYTALEKPFMRSRSSALTHPKTEIETEEANLAVESLKLTPRSIILPKSASAREKI